MQQTYPNNVGKRNLDLQKGNRYKLTKESAVAAARGIEVGKCRTRSKGQEE
jgi:hypothetical protein